MAVNTNNWKICIAPMLCWTDIHFRYLVRLLSTNVRLYTEMITTGALIYGDKDKFLKFNRIENPIACQIGGSVLKDLEKCAVIIQNYGFDEINLNCGCPSNKVQNAVMGACLMLDVMKVANCLNAMQEKVSIPVTIKHRIGIGKNYSYSQLRDFVGYLDLHTNCNTFIVHARNAILNGLSPKQNRKIPVLKYDYVYQLKKDFPHLNIIINGGIKNHDEIALHLTKTDGVMIGRSAYHNPLLIFIWDKIFFNNESVSLDEYELVHLLYDYVKNTLNNDSSILIKDIVRHYLGLFHGYQGVKYWRRMLSDANLLKNNNASIILQAWEKVNNYSNIIQ